MIDATVFVNRNHVLDLSKAKVSVSVVDGGNTPGPDAEYSVNVVIPQAEATVEAESKSDESEVEEASKKKEA